ncbi:MAG: insulinase family protein [Prevotellaceae bacterium]|jgi:predicted Zn-dependent peptidase|nr:insulinase family protein [Prevotellaceae bacterium]
MQIHTLKNGIRLLHIKDCLPITYCGFAINAGTRDEHTNEYGIAHFTEHCLMKGTKKRNNRQIIDRIEAIGGELDAYTTKEETFIYVTVPQPQTERAIDLLSDILFNSTFPKAEILKEKNVIEDEIQSYNDSPSELIFDEFEELIFQSSPLEHNILGNEKLFNSFTTEKFQSYIKRCYTTDNILFFIQGNIEEEKLLKLAEKYFVANSSKRNFKRTAPTIYAPQNIEKDKDTFQVHCLMGNLTYRFGYNNDLTTTLLNNIVGGPFMSSRLNMAVRERNGLVYCIDSSLTLYSDIGYWGVYFGCDKQNYNKCTALIYNELEKLTMTQISDTQLKKAKQMFSGNLLIVSQNKENRLLAAARSVLHLDHFRTEQEILAKLEQISAAELHKEAQQLFDMDKFTVLKFV